VIVRDTAAAGVSPPVRIETGIGVPVATPSSLLDRLRRTPVYVDYHRSFETALHLPLALVPADSLHLAHSGLRHENRFCGRLAGASKACGRCLTFQAEIKSAATSGPVSRRCFAGLYEAAVPVRVGKEVAGFLVTGQVRVDRPSARLFGTIRRNLTAWGLGPEEAALRDDYLTTRVLSRSEYSAALQLLRIFAEHLGTIGTQLQFAGAGREPPVIGKAKAFISAHADEALTLRQVARAANASAYYFCKLFHRSTGLHFVEYVARMRVEKVKNLLRDPNVRISEAAFSAGFQSLSQFNRVFKRVVGTRPRLWRAQLPR
jgi:AraC-like DNA-binding protein